MDALSDVLATLRVSGTVTNRMDARGTWAYRFPGDPAQLKFGTVLAGSFELEVPGAGVVRAGEGDVYLLAGGRDFIARSVGASRAPVDGVAAYRRQRDEDGIVRIGQSGPLVSLSSGRFTFDAEDSLIPLRQFPPLIHLRAADDASRALSAILDLLRLETSRPQPGADLAGGSLAGLLLVHALRIHLERDAPQAGWLAAFRDQRIARAMDALHGDLRHPWTVQELAEVALMSRTAFALRFRELVGLSPIEYLARWRMTLAKRKLREGDETVGVIGSQVGYESETAFNAAFKRATGTPPARYRHLARSSI